MENITDKTVKCPDCGETRKVKKIIQGNEFCNKCLERVMTQLEIWLQSPDFKERMRKALAKLDK